MKKLYTGPFGPMARMVWTNAAIQRIYQGKAETFLLILPTAPLLKDVRERILQETGGMPELYLLTFDEIAQQVIDHNYPRSHLLTDYEYHRFYDQLIEKHKNHPYLKELSANYHLPGVKLSLIQMLGELKRSGFTSEHAQRQIESRLGIRQKALAFLYIESEKELKQLSERNGYICVTREQRLEMAAKLLASSGNVPPWLSRVRTIWMDHYTDLTPLQYRVFERLAGLPSVDEIGIYLPYQESLYQTMPHLNELLKQTIASLEKLGLDRRDFVNDSMESMMATLAEDWETSVPKQFVREQTPHPEIRHLVQELYTQTFQVWDTPERISVLPCASVKREVQMVAKLIKQSMIEEDTLNPAEIAVIVRDMERYQGSLMECFEVEKIPLQLPYKQPLLHTPFVQQLLAFLHVQLSHWHRDHLIKLAEGAYVRWNNQPPKGFAGWVKKTGIRSGTSAWLKAAEREKGQEDSLVPGLLPWLLEVREKLEIFPNQATMKTFLEGARLCLQSFHVHDAILSMRIQSNYSRAWLKRDMDSLDKVLQSLEILYASAKRMGELERVVTFSQFVQEWSDGWQGIEIVVRKGDAGGVRCLEPSSARGLRFKQVFVLGCNESVFPITHKENWLLDDGERMLMREYGALPASHFHNEMERIFFQMALAVPLHKLTLSYVSQEVEENALPSSFLEEVLRIFPKASNTWPNVFKKEALSRRPFSTYPELVSSEYEYRCWLMSLGRQTFSERPDYYRREWFPEKYFCHILHGIQMEHQRGFGPFSAWDGYLDDPHVQSIIQVQFSQDRPFSISQLNEYMNSPLTFFFKRVLRIKPVEERDWEVSKLDKGNLLHEALRRFFTQHRGERLSQKQLSGYQEELTAFFREEAKRFAEGTIYEGSFLWDMEIQRLEKELKQWLAKEIQGEKSGDLRVRFLELSFGLPISEPDKVDPASQKEDISIMLSESMLRLAGKIDRMDVDEDGHFVIYDYKSNLSSDAAYDQLYPGSITCQLPLYLAAVKTWLPSQGVAQPKMVGGAFYSLRSKDQFKKIGMWSKELKAYAGISSRSSKGVFDSLEEQIAVHLAEVESYLHQLRKGCFQLTTRQKPDFSFADNAVYRYDPIQLRTKEQRMREERIS